MDSDQAWLTAPNLRIRIGPAGVLVGRDPGCDVVLADPTASRHHALVRLTPQGVAVRALGRQLPLVNGAPAESRRLLDGDRIDVPGLRLDVRIEGSSGSAPQRGWFVGPAGGPRLGVGARLAVGAGGDVAPEGWPELLVLRAQADRLVAEGQGTWLRNGVAQAPGVEVALLPGDRFGPEGQALVVERLVDEVPPTGLAGDLADQVELQLLTRGGRLRVVVGGDERLVWIADRRFALLASLLDPPAPFAPGDDVPDELVLSRVWPRQPHKSRVDLNVLVGRLRGDLESVGIAASWVARSEGGGATRFRLAPGAAVKVS